MVSKALDLLVKTVAIDILDGADKFDMKSAAALLEDAAIGDFVGQRMFEGMLQVRRQACFEQELCRL